MDADIAVVGAGPAGALAAYVLASNGAHVLLFDGSHPREKPCGGGVTLRALREAETARIPPLPTGSATTIRRVLFQGPDGRAVPVPLGDGTDSLVVVSRQVLDETLLRSARDAGAQFIPKRVERVSINRDAVELYTSGRNYRAGLIIGADGAAGVVRRTVTGRFTRSQLSLATGYFAYGSTSHDIVIRFAANPPGYLWSFPRPDHLAIGVCAQADRTGPSSLRDSVTDWMNQTGIANNARLEAYSWPIPSLSASELETQCVAGDRWMLVGDAAGLVDPLTREGIFFALRSGRLAAEVRLQDGSASERYRELLADDIYPELRYAAQLTRGFFRPVFIRLLLDALDRSDAVRNVMADLVAGRQPYATLVRRLLGTLEVGLAWHLLRLRWSVR